MKTEVGRKDSNPVHWTALKKCEEQRFWIFNCVFINFAAFPNFRPLHIDFVTKVINP